MPAQPARLWNKAQQNGKNSQLDFVALSFCLRLRPRPPTYTTSTLFTQTAWSTLAGFLYQGVQRHCRAGSILAEEVRVRECVGLALSTAPRLKHCPLSSNESRARSSKDLSLSSRPSCPFIFSLYRLGRISFQSDTLIDSTAPSASVSKNWDRRSQNKTSLSHPHTFPKQEAGKLRKWGIFLPSAVVQSTIHTYIAQLLQSWFISTPF